jgi:hypothetical protein
MCPHNVKKKKNTRATSNMFTAILVNFDCNVFQCTGLVSFLQKLLEFNLLFVRDFLIL